MALGPGHGKLKGRQPLPYAGMTVDEICALPVRGMAADDCRLFCWATNRYLPDAFRVIKAWGFRYAQTLVWHKPDVNLVGSVAPNSAEYLLVGTKGGPERLAALPSSVLTIARRGTHSQKPEAWLDHIETISPEPRLELFARRARFGWDYWGDESLGTASLPSQKDAA